MVNLVETLFAVCIVSLVIAGLAHVQSRSGPERAAKYLIRRQRFLGLGIASGIVAGILELALRF
jgi:hypothetical protein